ncbi:MAG: hypothetical protein EA402_02470 [Planctomycetota bacterium]|nr:MAG: hypothetical protein EA402_02470 [Planctomycetota bacterium]
MIAFLSSSYLSLKMTIVTLIATLVAIPLCAVERKDQQPLPDPDNPRSVLLHYSVQVPRHRAGDPPLPMLVLFHGTNLDAVREVSWTNEVLEVMGLRDKVILLAPQGGKGRGPWQGKRDSIRHLMTWAKRELPVDHRRIVFAGFSAGAGFIMNDLLAAHRHELAGAISFAGNSGERIHRAEATDPDVILIMGTDDNPKLARQWVSRARHMGHRVVYREIIGAGHGTVLGIPDTRTSLNRRDLITWALGQRLRSQPPSAEELEFLQRMAEARGRPQATEMVEVARIGGPEAGALIQHWLQSRDRGLQLAAARLSQETLFDGKPIAELAAVAAGGHAETGQAAAIALGRLAAWRFADARAALLNLAALPDRQARAMAAMGLKQAVAFTIYGQHEDQSLFAALVAMLRDPEVVVRRLAWDALSQEMPPVHDSRGKPVTLSVPMLYNPDQDPRTQEKALTDWEAWVRSLPESL